MIKTKIKIATSLLNKTKFNLINKNQTKFNCIIKKNSIS